VRPQSQGEGLRVSLRELLEPATDGPFDAVVSSLLDLALAVEEQSSVKGEGL